MRHCPRTNGGQGLILRCRFQVSQPEPLPKIGDDRQRHPRPRGSRYAKGSARALLHHHTGHCLADWLVVDFLLRDGLTARALGLVECGQWCNPHRPTAIVPGGIDLNGRVLRRWEFMRLPSETKEEMVQPAEVRELLGDWIKPEQGNLIRHALYTFRSLAADEWRKGRVLLAGDAAHLMPPFMGQAMCAGLRDVFEPDPKRVERHQGFMILSGCEARRNHTCLGLMPPGAIMRVGHPAMQPI
jgi:hypothetical protein